MNVRVLACRVVASVLRQEASLSSLLPEAVAKCPVKERPLLQQLCYGTLRFQPQLQLLSGELLKKPLKAKDQDVQGLILIGLYQLLHSRIPAHAAISETVKAVSPLKKPWAKGLVNAVLRSAQRQPELQQKLESNPVFKTAHPEWLIQSLQKAWPEQWQMLLDQNNQQGPMTLRINQSRTTREHYSQQLTDQGINHRLTPFSDTGLTLEAAVDVEKLPGFTEGFVSVQDEAAQLAADLLQVASGHRVLDACAAPGGKTCHILEQDAGIQCQALDVSDSRLLRVRENLDRLGLEAELLCADAAEHHWWDGEHYQRILLDAPCSATGVIRRNPDIKLTRRPEDIQNLATLQLSILTNLWSMLSDGGRLVYATCSVLPVENEAVILNFLKSQADAREVKIAADWGQERPAGRQLFPQQGGHDGFYYAVLEKDAG